MTVRVEGGPTNLDSEQEVSGFKFETKGINKACVVCLIAECETPIKNGHSEITVNREMATVEPAGEIVVSQVDDNGVTYSSDGKGALSHFSAQHRLIVQLGVQSEDIQGVVKLLASSKLRSVFNDRDPKRVRVYLGACDTHFPIIENMDSRFRAEGSKINEQILAEALQTSTF